MLVITLLVLAVCIDSFATSITYGIGKIKIPFHCTLLINIIGAAMLAASLMLADFISDRISINSIKILSGGLLFIMGAVNLFFPFIKSIFTHCKGKELTNFALVKKSILLAIFLDETKADLDRSKSLSVKEACFLGVALSVDSLASGFSGGLGICQGYFIYGVLLCFFLGLLGINLGARIGRLISLRVSNRLDLSFLSGILLILLGFTKLK